MIMMCPICKRQMTFNMTYSNGQPFVYYTCACGYNTLNQTYKTASNTTMEEIMVSDHT